MQEFCKGRFRARLAETPADLLAAQRLRHRCFRGGEGVDADRFDEGSSHLIVEPAEGGVPVGTCRFLVIPQGVATGHCYTAQFYDIAALMARGGTLLEIGRFCLDPDCRDPDALRLAWAALTRVVDGAGVAVMFGCSSFTGTDPAQHADALGVLAARHLGPAALRPPRLAAETVPLAHGPHDARRGVAGLPPLLRTYLAMGGWVGDHAVIDRDLNTLHVFTAVEIATIPPPAPAFCARMPPERR